jgi:hypothetical protein
MARPTNHPPDAAARPSPQAERRLIFNAVTSQFEPCRRAARFVRPIPFSWLHRANRLPGNATRVGVVWFLAGVKRSATFHLTSEAVDLAGCDRKTLYRCLAALEGAGLIDVQRRSGARPVVTLRRGPPSAEDEAAREGEEAIWR